MACTFIHPPDPLSASSNESSFQRAYKEQAAFSLIFMLALSKTLVQYMKTKYFQDHWVYSQEGCYKQHPLLKLATPSFNVSTELALAICILLMLHSRPGRITIITGFRVLKTIQGLWNLLQLQLWNLLIL